MLTHLLGPLDDRAGVVICAFGQVDDFVAQSPADKRNLKSEEEFCKNELNIKLYLLELTVLKIKKIISLTRLLNWKSTKIKLKEAR